MWLHPPEYLLDIVVEKILKDEVEEILIVPVCFQKVWFQTLAAIAMFWQDVPLGMTTRMTNEGRGILIENTWRMRVFFFSAFGNDQRRYQTISHFCVNGMEILPETELKKVVIGRLCRIQTKSLYNN